MAVTFAGERYIITAEDDQVVDADGNPIKIKVVAVRVENESGAAISAAAPVVIVDHNDKAFMKFLTLADDAIDHVEIGGTGTFVLGPKVTALPDGVTLILFVN